MQLSTNPIHLTTEDPTLASILDYLNNNSRTFNITTMNDIDVELRNTYKGVLAHKQMLATMNNSKEPAKLTDFELALVLTFTLPLLKSVKK